jgi:hypothetical protein
VLADIGLPTPLDEVDGFGSVTAHTAREAAAALDSAAVR